MLAYVRFLLLLNAMQRVQTRTRRFFWTSQVPSTSDPFLRAGTTSTHSVARIVIGTITSWAEDDD